MAAKKSGMSVAAKPRTSLAGASVKARRSAVSGTSEIEAKPVETVEAYIAALDPVRREIVTRLRRVVRDAAPRAIESLKWGQPVYEQSGLLCSIAAYTSHVNLGFYAAGCVLSDPDRLLEGTGEKMRHVKIRTVSEIRSGLFGSWVKKAVECNEDA